MFWLNHFDRLSMPSQPFTEVENHFFAEKWNELVGFINKHRFPFHAEVVQDRPEDFIFRLINSETDHQCAVFRFTNYLGVKEEDRILYHQFYSWESIRNLILQVVWRYQMELEYARTAIVISANSEKVIDVMITGDYPTKAEEQRAKHWRELKWLHGRPFSFHRGIIEQDGKLKCSLLPTLAKDYEVVGEREVEISFL